MKASSGNEIIFRQSAMKEITSIKKIKIHLINLKTKLIHMTTMMMMMSDVILSIINLP
jgi:hypothetical protein